MDFSLCLSALVALLAVFPAESSTECPSGYYKKQEKCQICTKCPHTQIIRKQCSEYRDTLCGAFKEFQSFFRSGSRKNKAQTPPPFSLPSRPSAIDYKDLLRRRKLVKDWAKKFLGSTTTVRPLYSAVKYKFKWEPYKNQRQKIMSTDVPTTENVSLLINNDLSAWSWRLEQWQELCFGLIGGLAAVCIMLIIYIIISRCKNHSTQKDYMSTVNEPVYQRARIFSRDRLTTTEYKTSLYHLESQLETNNKKKWMRTFLNPDTSHIEGNHYVDEVFEPNTYQSLETLISNSDDNVPALNDIRVVDNPVPPVPDSPRPTTYSVS